MLHLWAQGGPLDTFYGKGGGPLGVWRQWAPHAHGQAMKGGHFLPEDNPDEAALIVKPSVSDTSVLGKRRVQASFWASSMTLILKQ